MADQSDATLKEHLVIRESLETSTEDQMSNRRAVFKKDGTNYQIILFSATI